MTSDKNVAVDESVLLKIHGEGSLNGREKGFLNDKNIPDKSYREEPRAIISVDTFLALERDADDLNGAVVEKDGKDRRMLRYEVYHGVVLASYPEKCRGSDKGEERWWEHPIGYSRGFKAYRRQQGRNDEYIGEVYDSPTIRPIPEVGREYEDTWPVLHAIVLKGNTLLSQTQVVEVHGDKPYRPKTSLQDRVNTHLGVQVAVGERMLTTTSLEMREGKKVLIHHHYYLCRAENAESIAINNGHSWIPLDRYDQRINPLFQMATLRSRAKQLTVAYS